MGRIKAALRVLAGKTEKPATTEVGTKSERLTLLQSPWTRHYARKGLWKDIELLDDDEVIVARGLDFIARFATQFVHYAPDESLPPAGFQVEAPDNEMAMLEPLITIMQRQAYENVRYMVKFGDLFSEIVLDTATGDIANVKMFPYAYQLQINTDKYGSLLAGDPRVAMKTQKPGIAAYEQRDDFGNMFAAFWPYQIAHWGFGPTQGKSYHKPMLGPVISPAKRLRAIEDGISIARLDRAYQTRVHHVPVPEGLGPDEELKTLSEYRDAMTQDVSAPYDTNTSDFRMSSQEAPYQADTDIYVTRKYLEDGKIIDADVTAIAADSANLENLQDVFLLIRRVLCGVQVPADFLNLAVGQRSFIDKTTPEKREAFLYLGLSVQGDYVPNLRALFQLQLLLSGHPNPFAAEFRIILPRISPREAEVSARIDVTRATTAAIWQSLGIPREISGRKVLQMTATEIEKWVQSGGTEVPGTANPEEMAGLWRDVVRNQLTGGQESLVFAGEEADHAEVEAH